jgi:drug/metabolite transporter (DMT)-like permease
MDPYHLKKIVLFFCVVCASTAGELCISRAMKSIGEVTNFRPLALLKTIWSAMQIGILWVGLALMTVAFFSMLMLLSMENVSFVVPATALSYAAGAYGSRIFLGERVAHLRWAGVVLVCIGVALVWQGKG